MPVHLESRTIVEAMELMNRRRVRHLPVMHDEQLIGLVSQGDLTKELTLMLANDVSNLDAYIHGPTAISDLTPPHTF